MIYRSRNRAGSGGAYEKPMDFEGSLRGTKTTIWVVHSGLYMIIITYNHD